jgi:hypothetical protein
MVNGRAARRHGAAVAAVAGVVAGAWMAQPVHGQEALRVAPAPASVEIDGMLSEWGGVRMQRVGAPRGATMRYALAYDSKGLYVVAAVEDDDVVRTGKLGRDEDAVVLTLLMPSGRQPRGAELWLYPGVPGRFPSAVGLATVGGKPRRLNEARMVEAPLDRGTGYQFEAFIPWGAIPGAAQWERAQGAIRLRDMARTPRPTLRAEVASAEIDVRAPERIPELAVTGGIHDLLRGFLQKQGLAGVRPRADLAGDVSGDPRPERVVVVDRFMVVLGPGYREGKSYDFFALPVRDSAGVRSAELLDLTGNGRSEVVLRLRQSNEHGSRDVWQVLGVTEQGIRPLWGVELRKETAAGSVEASLAVRPQRRGPPVVAVQIGQANGLGPDTFREAPARDVEPILLPWGPVRARQFQWREGSFATVAEEPNPDYQPPSEPVAPAPRVERRATPAPRAARAPSPAQVIAAVRKQRGIAASVPARFERTANVAEDARPEHLVVLGRSLLVFGPGFRGGDGYFVMDLPVAEPADVLLLHTTDVTGDGPEEVLIRIRQHFTEGVYREVLLVYCFHNDSFHRVFAVEAKRGQGERFVRNGIRLDRRGRRTDIVVVPGTAQGWDASTWPFAAGDGNDGVEPLLLPWRDKPVRYGYVNKGITRK